MSQRNQEVESAALGLALVGVVFALLFFVLYALACFLAIIFTIVALCAWNEPFTVYNWTITPKEARIFICCGSVGLVALPLFLVFGAALLQVRIPQDWWGYILLGGYSLGALGLGSAILNAEQKEEAAKFIALPPAARSPDAPPELPAPNAEQPPFRFASWDDEEEW